MTGRKKPSIQIKFGAANDEVIVDGKSFERHDFSRQRFHTILIDALLRCGLVKRKKKTVVHGY